MGRIEKPNMLERLGIALNSSNLAQNSERDMPVDLITALGYVQVNPKGGAHGELEKASIDPRTELGGVLLRLKVAGDHDLEDRALRLMARWITEQRAFKRWKVGPQGGVLDRFTGQALAEWLWQTCGVCHGREFLGLDRGEIVEKRVRCTLCKGSGVLVRTLATSTTGQQIRAQCRRCGGNGARTLQRANTQKAKQCDACNGTGSRRPNDAERMRALGLAPNAYQKYWVKRFDWAAASFDRIDLIIRLSLQSQFRSNIKRT